VSSETRSPRRARGPVARVSVLRRRRVCLFVLRAASAFAPLGYHGSWMLELLVLVWSVWAIVRRAGRRKLNPNWFAVGALVGWAVFFLARFVGLAPLPSFYLRWACVGCILLAVEIVRPDPSLQDWRCPECRALNDSGALTCSCRRVRPDLRP